LLAPSPAAPDAEEQSALRFHLTVQRSRAVVIALATAIGLIHRSLGGLHMPYGSAPLFLGYGVGSAALFQALYRRRLDRKWGFDLFPLWAAADVVAISAAVYLSADRSYWYLWYLTNTAAAAFVRGNRAALAVSLANSAAYLGVAVLIAPEDPGPQIAQAAWRLTFLYGASILFVAGVSSLREKQLVIKSLRREDAARLEEVTRLAAELDRRREELDRLNAQLHESAITDSLTGLHNRRFLEAQIGADVATAMRAFEEDRRGRGRDPRNRALGLLLLDLDHFKRVNDDHGHPVGDRVLVEIASVLRGCVRSNDAIVRWGGEEFLYLARQVNPGFLPIIAVRLLRRIREHSYLVADGPNTIRMTCSIGWSYLPFPGEEGTLLDWRQVLKFADTALYLAKHNGRNMTVGVIPGPRPIEKGMAAALSDITGSLEAGYLTIESSARLGQLSVGS
jgi:diguanylate cyclase (GGDEF)-like protein